MTLVRAVYVLCLICYLSAISPKSYSSETYDVLIKNVTIIDGTGKAAVKGHIAIKDDKITAVGKIKAMASTVLDGSGYGLHR